MVTPVNRFLCLLMLCVLSLGAWAEDSLNVSVDRQEVRQNESLQLTITSKLEVDSALDFFNLNTLSIPQPDVGELDKDFEVMDRQQSYRVQIENNKNNSVITWVYTLLPKRSGDLEIPAVKYKDNESQSIAIKVVDTSQQAVAKEEKPVFLEAEVDNKSVYVQQQLIYTIRLFYSDDMLRGELTHPDHTDILAKQLGKQKEYTRYLGSRRFSVVERQYVIFPQKAGKIVIPEQIFTGTLAQRRIGRRFYSEEKSPAVEIDVKAPPASFSGKQWVPAQSLSIRDVWSDPAREIKVGDSLTRTISVQALGIEGVQIPPLNSVSVDGVKVYPEPESIDTEEHAAGVTGQRKETQALVAIKPGTYTLPAVSIPWWDVTNDVERVATLPERTITVLPGAQSAVANTPTAPSQTTLTDDKTDLTLDSTPEPLSTPAPASSDSGVFWPTLSGLLLIAWLATIYAWWRKPAIVKPVMREHPRQGARHIELNQLKKLAKNDVVKFVDLYTRWLQQAALEQRYAHHVLNQLRELSREPLNQLQRDLYGPNASAANTDLSELALKLAVNSEQAIKAESNTQGEPAPLYPT
ncbi:BatD family protein [Hahella aquimaris]|uniref:BatD family protein n=1 Tax=Hahella sp. HNIBRBA332 TaxID=3015983 RepID=UPI00273B1534|nr:BatD family protein [Hahella sp. HNIBRBA332]WLQ15055.1 BatD family protein [Hahella sp. HNIBRBA332]